MWVLFISGLVNNNVDNYSSSLLNTFVSLSDVGSIGGGSLFDVPGR